MKFNETDRAHNEDGAELMDLDEFKANVISRLINPSEDGTGYWTNNWASKLGVVGIDPKPKEAIGVLWYNK